jgi:hypothetical protein
VIISGETTIRQEGEGQIELCWLNDQLTLGVHIERKSGWHNCQSPIMLNSDTLRRLYDQLGTIIAQQELLDEPIAA